MRILYIILIACLSPLLTLAIDTRVYVTNQNGVGHFTLVANGKATPLMTSTGEYPGVVRALKNLQADVNQVTQSLPVLKTDKDLYTKEIVLVGTIGKSTLIDRLVQAKKLDVTGIVGKWETFLTQIVENPIPGVDRALVIAGSDKRGTIYGIYDLSAQIGVSPWNWWADVPVSPQSSLYVLPGRHTQGTPAVKYRGIFINDEAPALSGWAKEKFGGFNHRFYEKVFELILRLKGNYLWPAMWGSAFYDDDNLNPYLANEYGVVIGTTHHEPLMRAHDEWRRYGKGPWNYQKNEAALREFWKEGIRRMGTNESIVSVGMRGDGDEPMSRESNIALLERIVSDQRKIIGDVTRKEPSETPQLWALYKEVQEYYDKGMRVPDDVTLLLCDDNWGNIRKLPAVGSPNRQGGYGIYYHFDYVGGPRNYKWLNTSPIARTWEQMHLAYEHGVDRIWIVNVGDIKPMEFPIEFFLDYAWAPDQWPAERLDTYASLWAECQFGPKHARAIGRILQKYTSYNSRRKPELLSPDTYSLTHYREAETVVNEYNALLREAEQIYNDLPAAYHAAYYQLVLHPVRACANLNELYVTVAKNRQYATQRRILTNQLALRAKELFERDAQITRYYNDTLANGKWHHLMDQTHIGYTYWQQPDKNTMPAVKTMDDPTTDEMGVAVEGSDEWWPSATTKPVLPVINSFQNQSVYFDVFNRGKTPFTCTIETPVSWLKVLSGSRITDQERIAVSILDWKKVPIGTHRIPITVSGFNGSQVIVIEAVVENLVWPKRTEMNGFLASDGYVSMEAAHYTKAIHADSIHWESVPDIGRTGAGMMIEPVTSPSQEELSAQTPHLEYRIYAADTGQVRVYTYLSPTLNVNENKGLRFGISFDEKKPQVMDMHAGETNKVWEQSVANNIRILMSSHTLAKRGEHILKFWMVDPAVVLQKVVVDVGGLKSTYLGPPESFYRTQETSVEIGKEYKRKRQVD
ncbi:glycosyl hydrolase 115 family protein [Spirosoma aerolatum]|uniref:glycosyl hydrolase 115 family protein n=1 Tax=Spirosoma aerolatum TaxID=1211326 RepID=UPI0009AE9839|nr:glycosyl hydrolase 115 family protein [Spirosoma aerolatum]